MAAGTGAAGAVRLRVLSGGATRAAGAACAARRRGICRGRARPRCRPWRNRIMASATSARPAGPLSAQTLPVGVGRRLRCCLWLPRAVRSDRGCGIDNVAASRIGPCRECSNHGERRNDTEKPGRHGLPTRNIHRADSIAAARPAPTMVAKLAERFARGASETALRIGEGANRRRASAWAGAALVSHG